MAFWNRNKNTETAQLPAEYEQYYQAEANERRNSARLVSVGVVILAVLIISGLYFGVRALYRRAQNNDTPTNPGISQEVQNTPEASETPARPESDASTTPESTTPPPSATPTSPSPRPTATPNPVITVPSTGLDE